MPVDNKNYNNNVLGYTNLRAGDFFQVAKKRDENNRSISLSIVIKSLFSSGFLLGLSSPR